MTDKMKITFRLPIQYWAIATAPVTRATYVRLVECFQFDNYYEYYRLFDW